MSEEKEQKTVELGTEYTPPEIQTEKSITDDYRYILDLTRLKKVTTTVPTFIPKKFYDQIQFVTTGGSYYLYIYIDNLWKKCELL